MIKEKIISAYEIMAEKYNELIDHKPHNAYYDRPNTLQLLPDVNGKTILDAACGPGKYAEILIDKGAIVCLSPLKDWTKIEKQFSHSKFRQNGKNEKTIYI